MKHFSYLVTDDANAFLQKVACDDAEAVYGVRPVARQPEPMEKRASPDTPFEKIAARLERDIGILKTAGPCGLSFGMCKRANAYIDHLLSSVGLGPDEFAQVFDKVAAEAIETDLNASWEQLSAGCPDDLKPWLEWELAKIGYELAADAEMEKQAVFGLVARGIGGIGKMLMHGRAAGSAAKAGLKAGVRTVGREAKGAKTIVGHGYRGGKGHIKATMGTSKARMAGQALAKATGRGAAARAYRANLKKQHQAARAGQVKGLSAKQKAGGYVSPKQQKMLNKARGREAMKAREAVKVPAAPRAPAAMKPPAARAEQKAVKTQQETMRAQDAARKAAVGPSATRSGRGGPSHSETKYTGGPGVTPPATPKGLKAKLLKPGGWDKLTTGEKLQLGAGGYLGGKMLFGEGPAL